MLWGLVTGDCLGSPVQFTEKDDLAGAYYGYSAIPERWLSAVKDREKVDALIEDFLKLCGW